MPTINISATRQTMDPRSDELQCNVVIRNDGNDAVRLLSLRPRNPKGTVVQQILDSSLESYRSEKETLCTELSTLISQFIFESSAEYREQYIQRQREALREMTTALGIFGAYVRIFTGSLMAGQRRILERSNAWRLRVSGGRQARQYFEEFLQKAQDKQQLLATVYQAKLEQLETLERLLGSDERGHITDLEPGGTFSRTYVFNCSRALFNPKTYTITFDCAYVLESTIGNEKSVPQAASTDISATISPKPLVLNIVALLSSALGMTLNVAITAMQSTQSSYFFSSLVKAFTGGPIMAATVTALFFFNTYENTTVGKKLDAGVGWRSALIIGGLSGLMNEKVVTALKGLLG